LATFAVPARVRRDMRIARRIPLVALLLFLAGCAIERPAPPPPSSPPAGHVKPPPTPPLSPLPSPPLPAQTRTGEVRAVWVSDTTKFNWDAATAALQRAGFNAVYVNFVSGGAAFYPRSAVLPSVVSRDDIGRGIALAHQRGLAVHAKVIAAFMFRVPAGFQQQMIKANRVMRGPDGRPVLQWEQTWLCPSQKPNRDLMVHAIREILTRYPVDGVQLDYIRFCEQPSCYCSHCRREFEKSLGQAVKRWPFDVTSGPYASRFIEWKQGVINDWVRQCSEEVRRARPGLPISVDVFPDLARAREEKAQDWKLWLDRGWVDYLCTMTYTAALAEFEARVRQQPSLIPPQKLIVGIGSWKLKQMDEVQAQIAVARRYGAAGFALFSYDDFAARNAIPSVR